MVEVEIAILYYCRPLEARVNLRIGTGADGPIATTVVSRIGELTNTSGGFTSSCCERDEEDELPILPWDWSIITKDLAEGLIVSG